ncbi:MAG TPA: hypothetical protein VIK22_02665 [Candidatus Anoxymicrobiaceae bacterium]
MLIEVLKRQCPVCGFKLVTNSTIRWQSNGTFGLPGCSFLLAR